MKKKTLYKVVKAVWGSDRTQNLYFETKEEADKFYNGSDYVDPPRKVKMPIDKAVDVLGMTNDFLWGGYNLYE